MSKYRALDRIDFEILDALQNNARLSNKELAARIGLAPSSCLARVRRLTDDGVIEGFFARVNAQALGIGLEAMLTLRLNDNSRRFFAELAGQMMAREEVLSVFELSGAWDVQIHILCRDVAHLHRFVNSLSEKPEVAQVVTSLVFQAFHSAARPNYTRVP